MQPGTVDFGSLELKVRRKVEMLRLLRQPGARLNPEIEAPYEELHPEDHLRTVPGIGPYLVPLAALGTPLGRTLGNHKKMRGFSGLFPRRSQSGGKDRPGQQITKNGNNRLKRDLMLAANVARRIDPSLAQVYHGMMVEKGYHHRQALCTVATRLDNRIYAVLEENRPYQLRDPGGNSISVADAKALIADRF